MKILFILFVIIFTVSSDIIYLCNSENEKTLLLEISSSHNFEIELEELSQLEFEKTSFQNCRLDCIIRDVYASAECVNNLVKQNTKDLFDPPP